MNMRQSGFTLIELSIVLVIIGLIVGGVLVGQDLIKGAEIRAQISQIEKYDAAANTFRNKYGALPGDIENPGNFGFSNTGLASNGNGRIDRNEDALSNYNTHATIYTGEAAAFWRHLTQANLIAENIPDPVDAGNAYTDSIFDVVGLAGVVPTGKLAGSSLFVAVRNGLNQYYFARAGTSGGMSVVFSTSTELRVIDAFQLDSKMDDGIANTGRVITVTDFATNDTSGDCHASGTYATAASANQTVCMLQIRTSF